MVVTYKHNFNPRTIRKFRKRNDARHTRQLNKKLKESAEFVRESVAKLAPGGIAALVRSLKIGVIKKKGKGISIYFNKRGTLDIVISITQRRHRKIIWVNDGTGLFGPHKTPIVPRRRRVLKIQFPGETVFTPSTVGQPGQHFIEAGVNRAKLIVASKIASVFT